MWAARSLLVAVRFGHFTRVVVLLFRIPGMSDQRGIFSIWVSKPWRSPAPDLHSPRDFQIPTPLFLSIKLLSSSLKFPALLIYLLMPTFLPDMPRTQRA